MMILCRSHPMKKENLNPDDAKLGALLHDSRVSQSLPPRFKENVWRRIEAAEAPVKSGVNITWLEALAALMLRPRFAYATVAALMLGGILLGAYNGVKTTRQNAETRYVALVAPSPLR
jgi:hypothetical protein